MNYVDSGKRVLRHEATALTHAADALGEQFQTAVEWILECSGRVITCGVGKSGHIARKTAGTLSSLGSPSLFLHAAEAVHGDLGMVTANDVVILYTHSGETDEIVRLFPSIRAQGAKSMVITGRPESSAGRAADLALDTGVREEACPHNLAPTTSATAMLAVSDALAIAAMEARGFGREDFARFHPSGALGKRLLLTVEDVMRKRDEISIVAPDDDAIAVIRSMTSAGVGAACVEQAGALVGLVTEGDLRRYLLANPGTISGTARDMMNPTFAGIDSGLLAYEALEVFQNHPKKIGEMPVLEDGKLAGLLVLKDLLRSGIV